MKMTLRTDLQVILPRMDKAARYQELERQQGHLRHQFALEEQRLHSENIHRVPLLNPGEETRSLSEQERNKRRERGPVLKRKKSTKEHQPRGQDPDRGQKLDLWV